MVRFHHVNLAVRVGGAETEAAFLVDVLGYRRLPVPDDVPAAKWFEADDRSQVHLSEDPDHRPAARAHVAVEFGDDLSEVEQKLNRVGYEYRGVDGRDRRTLFLSDPAGNRWELRGPLSG